MPNTKKIRGKDLRALPIGMSIAEAHGGTLRLATNATATGSRFVVRLPHRH